MGNNNATAKRPIDEQQNTGDGNQMTTIEYGSPMDDSHGFIFPDHNDLLASELEHGTINEVKKVPAVVRWKGGGKEVFISGSYDNWHTKLPLNRSHDNFVAIVELPVGEHEYKFLVDGDWKVDPQEPTKENDVGILNNVLAVKPSDFEVFEALADDSSAPVKDYSTSPEEGYTQDVPRGLLDDSSLHPPSLPPHLLNKVLLNQDIDMSYEPSLLPEPQHVMLNHMYALSIKDGVMALSATHRYKKKFVTTLLYKPI
ncbi:5'-AMP-activated protein kinase subunit beta-1-like [Clavelina lepadiformis]|uniref:5'-AMP-activated protein kinase subunit beta-1-like n=1 Tax=Clavelina lepadiformis TaxID=159417 RepID=UPI004042B797